MSIIYLYQINAPTKQVTLSLLKIHHGTPSPKLKYYFCIVKTVSCSTFGFYAITLQMVHIFCPVYLSYFLENGYQ